jgi:hypothetical protein
MRLPSILNNSIADIRIGQVGRNNCAIVRLFALREDEMSSYCGSGEDRIDCQDPHFLFVLHLDNFAHGKYFLRAPFDLFK